MKAIEAIGLVAMIIFFAYMVPAAAARLGLYCFLGWCP